VSDFPTSPLDEVALSCAVNNWQRMYVTRFYLPFHLSLRRAASRWPVLTTPKDYYVAIYKENAQTLVGVSQLAAAPVSSAFHFASFSPALTLVPGAYWLALVAAATPVNMAVRSSTVDGNSPYDSAVAQGLYPYAGYATLSQGGQIPPSFQPTSLTTFAGSLMSFRLLDY